MSMIRQFALLIEAIAIYNRLVALRYRFQDAFAQIEVQLKRRYRRRPRRPGAA